MKHFSWKTNRFFEKSSRRNKRVIKDDPAVCYFVSLKQKIKIDNYRNTVRRNPDNRVLRQE